MATLTEQYKIIEDGRKLQAYISRFQSASSELSSIFDNVIALAGEYADGSDERNEIETKFNNAKTLLQNMLNSKTL